MTETQASQQFKRIRLYKRFNVSDRQREHSENDKKATWSKLSTARLRPHDRDLEHEVMYESHLRGEIKSQKVVDEAIQYQKGNMKKKPTKNITSFVSKLHTDARIKEFQKKNQLSLKESQERQQIQDHINARKSKNQNWMDERGMQMQRPVKDRV